MTTKTSTTPEWAKSLLGAKVSIEDGEVVIRFKADAIVAEGPDTDKNGKEIEPTLYHMRTIAKRGIEVPELVTNGVIPVISLNGWYPNPTKATRVGRVYGTAVKASDRLTRNGPVTRRKA